MVQDFQTTTHTAEALHRLGMTQVIPVKEQMVLDGTFPTVKSPNPENPEGFYLAVDLAKEVGSDLILGTDPDSDRVGVMYLGNMVELANTQELFDHPLHPYTEALMAAIPTTDVEEHRELRILEGDIPSPVNPPQGCKFHTRCAHCTEICKHAVPEWKEMAPGHFVACHHPLGGEE